MAAMCERIEGFFFFFLVCVCVFVVAVAIERGLIFVKVKTEIGMHKCN